MKSSHLLLITSLTALFTGCNSVTPIQYPSASATKTLSVSSKVEHNSRNVAGEHYITNSQILVSGKTNTTSTIGATAFGLIGAAATIAIDNAANHKAINKSSLNQPIRFDQLLTQNLKNEINQASNQNTQVLDLNQNADIKISPYAALSFASKPNVSSDYGVVSEFKNSANNDKKAKREYVFVSKNNIFSLAELEANNNLVFMQNANKAFDLISKAIVLDINHQFSVNEFDAEKQNKCQTANAGFLFFLKTPDDSCIGVTKTSKGEVYTNTIFVVEH